METCYKCGTSDVVAKSVKKAGHVGTHVSCNKCTGKHGGKSQRFYPSKY